MVAAIQLALQFSEIYREEEHAKQYCLFQQVYICHSINFGTSQCSCGLEYTAAKWSIYTFNKYQVAVLATLHCVWAQKQYC